MVDDNENIVDNNNGKQNKLMNESIVSTKEKGKREGKRRRENLSEEEKKSRLREKNRLRMKAFRESLSDEQKAQLREQERVKRQQQRSRLSNEYIKQQELRANHSDEERDEFSDAKRQKKDEAQSSDGTANLRQQQQRRATLSEEERALAKKKDAERHRLKYHEESSFAQKVFEEINSRSTSDEDDEDEALKRAKYWILYREKRNAQSRIYKRERYAKLKEAQKKLTQIAEEAQSTREGGVSETEVQHLQLLADKRKRILEYSRNYKRAYQKQPIEQPEIQVEGSLGSGQGEVVQESLESSAVKEQMPRGNVPDDSEESLINFER